MEKLIGEKVNIAVFVSGEGSNLKNLIKFSKKKNLIFLLKLLFQTILSQKVFYTQKRLK